ncbi:MAG: hypothetical protein GIKADHBN_03471 [Phycisphaerales bacterium]|nr:hypothetical protein [Phycisphaerales bacterium]
MNRSLLALTASMFAAAGGCYCDRPVATMSPIETATFEQGPFDSRVSPAPGGILAVNLAPPVYRLVHTPVSGSGKLTYLAMCAPWKPSSTDGSIRTIDTRFLTRRMDFVVAHADAPATGGLLGTASPAISAPSPMVDEYDAAYINLVSGYGWIYLTGSRPMVKTKLVIGGSDGTTFVVQVGKVDTTEYHRFALLVPPSNPSAQVALSLATAPNTVVATLTQATPYIVFYEQAGGFGTVINTGPQAAIGTGPIWDNFQAAINDAIAKAAVADLPVP